jgi:hypothetical protein
MDQAQGSVENNFNYNYLLVQTILKMRDAQAEEHPAQYWTYFEYALGLVLSHLDFQLKGEIQQDYAVLMAAFRKINALKDTELNTQSKKSLINKLKEDFADAHRFYIMQALNRVGVVRVEDEGIIDFESTDLDTMTKIVRDLPNGTIASFEKQEGKKTPPLIKPEMVLVTYKDKLIEMPKDEYLKMQNENASQEEAPLIKGEMPEEGIEVEEGDDVELDSESEDAGAKETETQNDDTAVERDGDSNSANPAQRKHFGWKSKYEM